MYKDKNKKRLYDIWHLMKRRCDDEKTHSYNRYGGRGITYCDSWKLFDSFYNWAINNGYKDGLTLDRINFDGNYEPSNCKWSTWKEQQNNKCNNQIVEYNNQRKTVSQWAEITGLKIVTIKARLRHGWSIEKTLTTPVRCLKTTPKT